MDGFERFWTKMYIAAALLGLVVAMTPMQPAAAQDPTASVMSAESGQPAPKPAAPTAAQPPAPPAIRPVATTQPAGKAVDMGPPSDLSRISLDPGKAAVQQAPQPTVQLKPGEVPGIAFDNETFNFGRIPAGGDVVHDFWFTNTGNGPLEILSAKPS